jgi:hypothetical protein
MPQEPVVEFRIQVAVGPDVVVVKGATRNPAISPERFANRLLRRYGKKRALRLVFTPLLEGG